MSTLKFHQLIDIAIGFPETGYVNFSALHCLLTCIAQKLGITDDIINYVNKEKETVYSCNKVTDCELQPKTRLFAGSNADETISNDELNELSPRQTEESLNESAAIPQQDQFITTLNEQTPSEQYEQEPDSKIPEQIADLPSPISNVSIESNEKIESLNDRLTNIESENQKFVFPKDFLLGLGIMKDQIEFAIEQLLLLTFLTLSKTPDLQLTRILHSMAQTLQDNKKINVYVASSNTFQDQIEPTLNWQSSGLQLKENVSENDILEIGNPNANGKTSHPDELDHLCYSPEKLLDQLMQLKSEFCVLTNKVNELSSRLLQQENQRTLVLIHEIEKEMQEVKQTTINLRESQSRNENLTLVNASNIDTIKNQIEEIIDQKVDKSQLEIQLADKVDYNQLQRKVSCDQMSELQGRIEKNFSEIFKQIKQNDEKFSHTIDDLQKTLGFSAIDGVLKSFKENINQDIQNIRELLNKYMEATNGDCAAAGTRIKVLADLACLSCDNDCVMRTMENAKVAKLPNAYSKNTLSPLITYELGSIRKSGLMGYYRKDEFPHATNAWLDRQSTSVHVKATTRHAGGQHTVINAKDRIKKMSHRK